jgi:hypothetical protein
MKRVRTLIIFAKGLKIKKLGNSNPIVFLKKSETIAMIIPRHANILVSDFCLENPLNITKIPVRKSNNIVSILFLFSWLGGKKIYFISSKFTMYCEALEVVSSMYWG